MQATKRLLHSTSTRASSEVRYSGICRPRSSLVAIAPPLRRQRQTQTRIPPLLVPVRSFGTSSRLQKKGGKAAREASRADPSPSSSSSNEPSSSAAGSSDDASDFTALKSDIQKSIERLRADLSKLRSGGRFNPDVLDALRVQLKKGSEGAATVVKLGDVAQVVPRGRTVQVLVGEQEHLKPVASAIQSSPLSLTPQPDPTAANPLLLTLAIPPPTAESRRAAVASAAKAGDVASNGIRAARQAQQKKLRAMQLAKSARPDDLKKAGAGMEKVVERGTAEVKKIVDAAKKALDV